MRNLLYHPISIVLITISALIFYISLHRTEQKIQTSSETVRVLDQEVNNISSEVTDLEQKLQDATSSATREKIIRDELLMQRPGEYVVQLPALEEIEKLEKESQKSESLSPRETWLRLLFNY